LSSSSSSSTLARYGFVSQKKAAEPSRGYAEQSQDEAKRMWP
jgi:hypothetical protein